MLTTILEIKRTPRVSKKTGKPFVSLGIRVPEHGEAWLSGFGNQSNAEWQVGNTVEIEVEKKGEYLNFTVPKQQTESPTGNAEIKNTLTFKVIPLLEQNNAGIQKLEYLFAALQDRIDFLLKEGEEITSEDTPF